MDNAAIRPAPTAAACENQNQTAGTVIGAGTGALVGSRFGKGTGRVAATIAGAMIGAYLGNQIGKALDERDRRMAERNAANSMTYGETGTTSTWRNPNTGNEGTITPTSGKYRGNRGRVCRDFQEKVTLADGKSETITGFFPVNKGARENVRRAISNYRPASQSNEGGLLARLLISGEDAFQSRRPGFMGGVRRQVMFDLHVQHAEQVVQRYPRQVAAQMPAIFLCPNDQARGF